MIKRYVPSYVKNSLKQKRSRFYHAVAKIWAGLHQGRESKVNRVLLLPPSPDWGSLGDEAMTIASCEYLQKKGYQVGICVNRKGEIPNFLDGFDQVVTVPNLYDSTFRTLITFTKIAKKWDALGVFGADVIDGVYNRYRSEALLAKILEMQELGKRAALLGSSIQGSKISSENQERLEAIGEARIHFRDPVSALRVRNATGLEGVVVADAAFLLEPRLCSSGRRLSQRLAHLKNSTNFVWGVNTNWRHFDDYISREDYVSLVVQMATRVNDRFGKTGFVLLPHDTRGGRDSDFAVATDVHRKMKEINLSSVCPNDEIRSYSIKKVCQELDLVLTSRMHVAIAALGVGCPVASISYQGKFEGLYQHFDLEEGIFPGDKISDELALQDFALHTFEMRKKIKGKILKNLPEVKSLAKKNFSFLSAKN